KRCGHWISAVPVLGPHPDLNTEWGIGRPPEAPSRLAPVSVPAARRATSGQLAQIYTRFVAYQAFSKCGGERTVAPPTRFDKFTASWSRSRGVAFPGHRCRRKSE